MKHLCRTPIALLLALCTPSAFAQKIDFSIGARAGILLNKAPSNSFARNESKSYVIGPVFEIGFRQRFGIEFAPTFRRSGQTYSFNNSSALGSVQLPPGASFAVRGLGRVSGYDFDLPVIGKYYFTRKESKVRPFFGYGVAGVRGKREFFNEQTTVDGEGLTTTSKYTGEYRTFRFGQTASAGVNWKVGRIDLVPEVRYLQDRAAFPPATTKNRFEIFLGFRF